MKAERIDSSLHPRSWAFNRQADSLSRQFVLLTDGAGEADAGTRHAIAGPAVLWLGDMSPGRLRLEAGATGYRCSISDAMVIAAIGDQAESVGLAYLADRSFVLSLSGLEERQALLERCFNGILAEVRQPLEGSPLFLSGLLRLMLVTIIRITAGSEGIAPPGIGERSGLLQRFRQLVEMNFRSHWTIARYADALGITPDRLHAICTAGIGKSPKALVSERLAHEAALRLERSSLTIQQLGHALGFNDPAHFSTFFRRMTGMAPGRYRKAAAASRLEGRNAPTPNFADWP